MTCFGGSNGAILASYNGGIAPYEYLYRVNIFSFFFEIVLYILSQHAQSKTMEILKIWQQVSILSRSRMAILVHDLPQFQ